MRPFSQQTFLLKVEKAQELLITLMMTLFYLSVPESNDSVPACMIYTSAFPTVTKCLMSEKPIVLLTSCLTI